MLSDRLIVDAAAAAASVFDDETELGPCGFVAADGTRYHSRQRGPDYVQTIVRPDGSRTVYEIVGVDGSKML